MNKKLKLYCSLFVTVLILFMVFSFFHVTLPSSYALETQIPQVCHLFRRAVVALCGSMQADRRQVKIKQV